MVWRTLAFIVALSILAGCEQTRVTTARKQRSPTRPGIYELTYEMAELTPAQRRMKADILSQVQRVFEERVTKLGFVEATVRLDGDRILVGLPTAANIQEARRVLGLNPKLAFYTAKTVVKPRNESITLRPYDVFQSHEATPDSPVVEFTDRRTGERISPMVGGKPNPKYLKVIESWGQPIVTGVDLQSAGFQSFDDGYVPLMHFTNEGAKKMRAWSGRYRNNEENIAAVLDNVVLSVARLERNTVLSEHAIITGKFSAQYVKTFRDALNMARLPVHVREVKGKP